MKYIYYMTICVLLGLLLAKCQPESELEAQDFPYDYMLNLQGDIIVIEDDNQVQYTIALEDLEEFIIRDNL